MATECIKELGILPEWFDSATAAYYDGYIHLVGQAEKAVTLKNTHYVLDVNGNRIYSINAPFGNRGEGLASLLNGRLYQVGSTTINDTWYFDPNIAGYTAASWQFVSNFASAIGSRTMAAGCDANGWFYILGGWTNNTIYKTQNFTSWTFVANLPSNINRLSSAGCCFFNNKIYIVGGVSNVTAQNPTSFYNGFVDGYVYTLDPVTDTLTQIYQDKVKFGQCWGNLQTDGTKLYWVRGFVSSTQALTFSPGDGIVANDNQRGMYSSFDGITWTTESLYSDTNTGFLFERHATPNCRANNAAYFIGGFAANDMWKLEYSL